jgi:acyl-CoA oxidase
MLQGGPTLLKKYGSLISSRGILGCYLQTELGHGTGVSQLETTATFLPLTQEFEIHSPTFTSSKWWIGALGKTSTHGVLQAKLILPGGKDVGPHLFLIHLRSMGMKLNPFPLPWIYWTGIQMIINLYLGSPLETSVREFLLVHILSSPSIYLGPKACDGHSPNDNGFARFDRVRIPKENMLSGFAQVTPEGEYVQPPHAKLSYGGVSTFLVA